jgi:hypothetical protein
MPRRTPRRRATGGRPTVLTDDARTRFLEAVRNGAPLNLACSYAGFSYPSFARWMAWGSDAADAHEQGRAYPPEHEGFREFWEAVQRARAAGAMTDLLLVQKAARGGYVVKETTRRYRGVDGQVVTEVDKAYAPVDWRAASWVLDRTHAAEFRRPTQVELSGPGGGPVEVAAADVDALASRLVLNIAAARADLPGPDDPVDGELVDDQARAS